jgi:hypothetical protein
MARKQAVASFRAPSFAREASYFFIAFTAFSVSVT